MSLGEDAPNKASCLKLVLKAYKSIWFNDLHLA